MDVINERLVVGADLGYGDEEMKQNLDRLLELGVTHIIDCRVEWSDEEYVGKHAPQVAYLQAPHDDNGVRAARAWFDMGVDFALKALEADPDAKLYVHCHMGVNRGPSMAFAILLALGWEPLDAYDRIVEVREEAWVLYATQAYRWWLKREPVSDATKAKAVLVELKERIDGREQHALRVIRGLRQTGA
jgi:dual specificity phosphatase 3